MALDLAAFASEYWIGLFRFILGFIGSFVYFMSVKSGFLPTERVPNAFENIYMKKLRYVLFFCMVGGLLASLIEGNWMGSFLAGVAVRPLITRLYLSVNQGGNV